MSISPSDRGVFAFIGAVTGVPVLVLSAAVALSVANPPALEAATAAPAVSDPFDPSLYALAKLPPGEHAKLVEYGKALTDETWRYLGPHAEDPSMRYSGNDLACKSCHLQSGMQPFAAPWVGVTKRYPSFRGREGRVGTIEDRIDGCMQRSMNGKPLPHDSREMKAFVAYMEWLSRHAPPDGKVKGQGFVPAVYPDRKVDLDRGKQLFADKCSSCHQTDGRGVRAPTGGYSFPPLAGDDSYNVGAGMNRVLTAASFIKNNMPLGATSEAPMLTDEEAYDVAGYIDSLPRPAKGHLEDDFPDRKLKPMSTPYGPFADAFPEEQHKLGPFKPIHDHYATTHGLDKAK